MNSNSISRLLLTVIAVVGAIYVGINILLNPTGGISGVSMLLTGFAVLVSLRNPRAGIFVLTLQAVYIDELKRLGVYYGAVSRQTTVEILIGPLLTLIALNLSVLLGALFNQHKIPKTAWIWYAICPFFFAYIYFSGTGSGFQLQMYNGATAALYMTIIPIICTVLPTFNDWKKFFGFQAIVAAPAALWGIWQYYNGFNDIEWTYALSGLSEAHSFGMLQFEDPRVFGLFGSSNALGCVAMYGAFCIWRGLRERKHRWWFLAMGLMYLAVCVYSKQRSVLFFPLIFLVFALAYRTRPATIALYGTGVAVFLVGIFSATWLLEVGIGRINDAIRLPGKWGEQVLNVNTFSDRLRGWERLGRAETWSLFGTGIENLESGPVDATDKDFNHDMINKLLMQAGGVGLAAVLIVGVLLAHFMHRIAWKMPNRQARFDGAFVLGCVFPFLIMSIAGGGNFTTTPINLMIWSMLAGIFALQKELLQKARVPLPQPSSPAPGRTALTLQNSARNRS